MIYKYILKEDFHHYALRNFLPRWTGRGLKRVSSWPWRRKQRTELKMHYLEFAASRVVRQRTSLASLKTQHVWGMPMPWRTPPWRTLPGTPSRPVESKSRAYLLTKGAYTLNPEMPPGDRTEGGVVKQWLPDRRDRSGGQPQAPDPQFPSPL